MALGIGVVIVAGILVFSYFKGLKVPGLTDRAATTQSQDEATTQKHVVTKGESLWSIAQKYYGDGFKWKEIAEANKITNPDILEIGQTISVPGVTQAIKDPITGGTYTVVKGDNLWNIAVRAYGDGYKWVKIAQENNLSNPNLIHRGNVLTLPR